MTRMITNAIFLIASCSTALSFASPSVTPANEQLQQLLIHFKIADVMAVKKIEQPALPQPVIVPKPVTLPKPAEKPKIDELLNQHKISKTILSPSQKTDLPHTATAAQATARTGNDFKLAYGKEALQFGELSLPISKGPYPVAIILHGGCWLNHLANTKYMNSLAKALPKSGVATWNIEYRGVDSAGGGWPGTFNDIAKAADFLNIIAKQYDLNLNKVIVIGHSAGGHLALWLAGRANLPKESKLFNASPLKIAGVITLGGIPDLIEFADQSEKVCGSDTLKKLVPDDKLFKEASPFALLPLKTPQILIYGDQDNMVSKQYAAEYLLSGRYKKDDITLIEVKKAGHHDYLEIKSPAWPALMTAVDKLLKLK